MISLSLLFFKWWYVTSGSGHGSSSMSGAFVFMTVIVIVGLMVSYYFTTRMVERKRLTKAKAIKKLTEPLSVNHKTLLAEKSKFYNQLDAKTKEEFEKRVRYYMSGKMFTSENGYAVTDEMKVLISAAACQITLGLPVFANTNYTHILIMPNANMEPSTATRNTIVLPWREFLEGYADVEDGQNEGLKVMAMSIYRDNRLQDQAYKLLNPKKLQHWEQTSQAEAANFMSGMFDSQNTSDKQKDEYFAQAAVYFFELPIAFRKKYPALYEALAGLLNQDPVKRMAKG
jgi:MtfA peptidase